MHYFSDESLMVHYEPWRYRGSKDLYFSSDKYVLCFRLSNLLQCVYTQLKTYTSLRKQPYCSVCGHMVYVAPQSLQQVNNGLLTVCHFCYEGVGYRNENKYDRQ